MQIDIPLTVKMRREVFMRQFSDYNPIAVTVYFLCAAGIAMFSMNPVIILLSLFGAVMFLAVRKESGEKKRFLPLAATFFVLALINPIFSHNGVTVLFVLNDIPFTLEAAVYGVVASAMIVSALCWFRSFSRIMTSDRLLYLLGGLSPKLALIFSTALRYVPLFGKQAGKIKNAQKALGLFSTETLSGQLRGNIRIFSVMITWALENGIVTSDSMTARGYGIGKRTHFTLYRFHRSDLFLLLLSLSLFSVVFFGTVRGALAFSYYPAITGIRLSPLSAVAYSAYGLLVLLPSWIQIQGDIRWKYLLSKN